MNLSTLGWSDFFEAQTHALPAREGLYFARVIAQHGDIARISLGAGDRELDAELRGRLRNDGVRLVAGDFVAARGEGHGVIEHVLERKTKLARKDPSRAFGEQVLAANVDTAFIVMALDSDYSPRRLERYLIVTRDGGVDPVVVLSKADLELDYLSRVEECAALALGAPVLAISTHDGTGLDELRARLRPQNTVVLLGSSGVGKSSLLNVLLGEDRQRVNAVRESDGKGRHTTTHRSLMVLPNGALIIDTPGMRELGLWDAPSGFDSTFADVGALAEQCKFGDCRHEREPGCAVRRAIEEGRLDASRLESYLGMRRELEYLERRDDPAALSEQRRKWKIIHKAAKKHSKRDW